MNKILRYLPFLVLQFTIIEAFTQQYVTLPAIEDAHHFAKDAIIFEDESSEITIDDFLENENFIFEEIEPEELIIPTSDIPYMDFTTSTFWMKLKIENDGNSIRNFDIELARPLTNEVELYILDEKNNLLVVHKSGDNYPFLKRPFSYRKFIFPVSFPSNSKRTLLIRAKSDGEILKLPIKFWEESGLTEFAAKENFFLGFYYGFIALVVILFAFFGVALRQTIYFYFVSYVFIMGLFQFSLDGFAYQYLWPGSIYLGNHAILITAAISMLSLLAYANKFLDFNKEKKWFTTTYKVFFVLVCICLITSLTKGFLYEITYPVLNGLSFIITTFFFLGIYLRYKSGHKPGLEITLAFAFLWFGAISFILSNVNIIQSEFLASNSLKIASAIEITFLSISLAARYRLTQNLKLKAEKNSVERLEQINKLKNEQTETLEREVNLRTHEISKQRDILETQNKDIIQSITYAQRLQNAILPSNKLLEACFPEYSIFFRPKDIVSGDFYWLSNKKDYVYFAVADCTGHGVPGAMVSVVGFNSLNQCVNGQSLTDPGKILDSLTNLVEHTFSKKDTAVSDGMDIALCRWNYKNELQFAGAFNSLYQVRNGELTEYKANRQPIGKFIKREPFKTITVEIEKGDTIYIFSDGYLDQFGGEKGKKLKSPAFKRILLEADKLPSKEFNNYLMTSFDDWRGHEEQIDDVCVMKVKF